MYVGTRTNYNMQIRLSEKLQMSGTLLDSVFSSDSAVVSIDKLPAEIQSIIDERLNQMREARANAKRTPAQSPPPF